MITRDGLWLPPGLWSILSVPSSSFTCRLSVQGLQTKLLTWSLSRFQPGPPGYVAICLLVRYGRTSLPQAALPPLGSTVLALFVSSSPRKELTDKLGHMWVVELLHAGCFPEELFNVTRGDDVSWERTTGGSK